MLQRRLVVLDAVLLFLVTCLSAAVVTAQERQTVPPVGPRVHVVCSLFAARIGEAAKTADAISLAAGHFVPLDAALAQSSADLKDLAASLKGRFGLDAIDEVATSGADLPY